MITPSRRDVRGMLQEIGSAGAGASESLNGLNLVVTISAVCTTRCRSQQFKSLGGVNVFWKL